MSDSTLNLNAQQLRDLLGQISTRLEALGKQAQLFVVGGAAMALAHDADRMTHDVDALFVPSEIVREVVAEIGMAEGLASDWVNDGAKGFMPGNDENAITVFSSASLIVQVASVEYLLAMKLHSGRDDRDIDDAVTLFIAAGYTDAHQCLDLLKSRYPESQLLPRHTYIAYDVAERARVKGTQVRPGSGWSNGDSLGSASSADEGGPLPEFPVEVLLIARRRQSASGEGFDVSEEFMFGDGRRVVINADRGFTMSDHLEVSSEGRVRVTGYSAILDEEIRQTVMNVVGADEGELEGSQPWERLAWLARGRGLSVTADYLRKLPLRIEVIR